MKKVIFSFVVLFMLYIPLFGYEIIIATSPWPPYAGKNMPEWGFTTEIIKEAFKATGNHVRFIITDWTVCLEKGAIGEYDGLYNVFQTVERTKTYAFSYPYTIVELVFICRKGRNIEYSSLEELTPYRIAVGKGYAHSREFDQADYLTKIEFVEDINGFKMLFADEVDLVAINKVVAIHILKNNPLIDAGINDVDFLSPPISVGTSHIMFSKANDDFLTKMIDFNNGLSIIMENGMYDNILMKHGYPESDVRNQ